MGLEDLEAYGMARIDETGIRQFLSNQRVGVLGLPTDGTPYLVPLSFGFDGDPTSTSLMSAPRAGRNG